MSNDTDSGALAIADDLAGPAVELETEQDQQQEPEATEQAPKPAEAAKETPPAEKLVPLAALHEERAKRKELQASVARMEQRVAQMAEQFAKPKEQAPPPPDLSADPVGHFDARLKPLEQNIQQMTAAQQQAAQEQAVIQAYKAAAGQYIQAAPEAQDAYAAWINGRIEEHKAAGFPPEQAIHLAQQEEFAIAYRALQSGNNPMEVIHNIAKARGWQPKKTEPKTDPAAKLETVAKGIAATKPTPGAPAEGDPDDLAAILAIEDEDEFAKALDKFKRKHG